MNYFKLKIRLVDTNPKNCTIRNAFNITCLAFCIVKREALKMTFFYL